MSEPFTIFKDKSGAFIVVSPEGKTICSTWDRERAESTLLYHKAQVNKEHPPNVVGTWDD